VILVKGKITINTQVHVPSGSFVLFAASDNIDVAATVGETTPTVCNITTGTGCDLEGYYSTDKSFTLLSKDPTGGGANCGTPDPDLQLNAAGSIVVHANTGGVGGFSYTERDMCNFDSQCPVFSITERPDFVLNAPGFLLFPRRLWQEVAP